MKQVLPITPRRLHSSMVAWFPAIIIFVAMLLASYWVFLMPIFQSPDEDYHADYLFRLYSAGRLVRGNEAPLAACSHPFVIYLLKATNGQAVKYNQVAKMPEGYGTKEFFKSLTQKHQIAGRPYILIR